MSAWLSGIGIVLVLVGAWFVAFEVVAKFEGETHGGITSMGGITKIRKLGTYLKWERKRNIAMWAGLAFITVGSILQLIGVVVQGC